MWVWKRLFKIELTKNGNLISFETTCSPSKLVLTSHVNEHITDRPQFILNIEPDKNGIFFCKEIRQNSRFCLVIEHHHELANGKIMIIAYCNCTKTVIP